MQIINKKISELQPADYNPRQATEKQFKELKASIEKFGFVDPVIVNKRNNRIVGGHFRTKVAEDMGITEVPVFYIDLSDEDEQELNVRLNANTGSWDFEMLNNLDLDLLKDIGFDEKELSKEFDKFLETEEDDVPEVDETKTASKLGEVYELGRHRLMCGDATKKEDVEKLMDGNKADMVFTDPPYGIGKDIENDDMQGDEFNQWNMDWVSIMPVKDNCAYIAYHSTRTFPSLLNASVKCGWKYEKMFFLYRPDKFPAHTWNGFMMTSQAIMLFSKGKPEYNKISPAHQDVFTVTSLGLGKDKTSHPTQKPLKHTVDLLSHFKADIVLDLFGGSGSTLIASEQTKRTCYMMELDPKYCDVIKKRYNNINSN